MSAGIIGEVIEDGKSRACLIGCDVRPDGPGDVHLINSSEAVSMAYRKRAFLNPISEGAPSFIHALADSSDEGTYTLGNHLLIVADCNRRIMLEFPLTSKRARKNSLAKIDLLADVVNRFRDAVHAEAKLIDQQTEK